MTSNNFLGAAMHICSATKNQGKELSGSEVFKKTICEAKKSNVKRLKRSKRIRMTRKKMMLTPTIKDIVIDQIKTGDIAGNVCLAQKYIPKSYRKPISKMMYVDCEINGKKVKALIDTGCNKSTISMNTANKCGITNIIDTNVQNQSIGIDGSIDDSSNIHFMIVKFGMITLPISLQVQNNLNVDMIIGLDFMSYHKVITNIKENGLDVFSKYYTGFIPFSRKISSKRNRTIRHGRDKRATKVLYCDYDKGKSVSHNIGIKSKRVYSKGKLYSSWKNRKWEHIIRRQIRKSNVSENRKLSLEHIPKVYRNPVPMLRMSCNINGQSIRAIIDSGCNITVMSKQAAKRCGFRKIIDPQERIKVRGAGGGATYVIGVMHCTLIEIGDFSIPCTVVILDKLSEELILGLDILLHRMIDIDIRSKSLKATI